MFFNQSADEVLKNLNSSKNGLSDKQAKNRIDNNNLNKFQEEKRTSIFKKFLYQFKDIMVIILLISAVISISLAIIDKRYQDLFEGGIILFIVILNAAMGVIQENKAENALENLKKRVEPCCKVMRDGEAKEVRTEELVVGDIVILEAGNIVPADLRLIESHNLMIDEASLTGESVAVNKDANKIIKNNKNILAEQINMVFSGTIVMVGRAKGVVVKIGKHTEMGKIAKMLSSGKKETTPLQKSLNKIGKIISYIVICISIVIFFAEFFISKQIGFMEAFLSAIALAVAAIPESLPAVITIIMALGVQNLAGKNAVIKRLHAVETLGNCQVICTDKTGTLTLNKMTVKSCYFNGKIYEKNIFSQDIVFHKMVDTMVLCNDSIIKNGEAIGEPTENALLNFCNLSKNAVKNSLDYHKRIWEIPFSSDRKLMTVVTEDRERQIECFTKGAVDILLEKCKYILHNGKKIELTKDLKQEILKENERMCSKALRVLALAYNKCFSFNKNDNFEKDLIFLGLVGMIDPPRKECFEAVERCFKAGLKPIMITGDHKNTAFAVAKELNIANEINQVITGEELNNLNDEELNKLLNRCTVFARVNPEHKVRIVETFKKSGKIVAMTGDGVNDAPSLKIADIGIGMGIMGTEVTKEVADMIITDDNFASIVSAVEEGRKIYSNIQKTIQFLLSTNAVEVVTLFLSCLLFPNNIFLLPTQILFINFITDSLPAIGLGTEKMEKEVMNRPPNSNNNIIDKKVAFNILYQAILQISIVMIVYVIGLRFYNNMVASTMAFFVINYMQLLHSINLKTSYSLKNINIFANKTFNITFLIGMSLITIVAVVSPISSMFGLCSLNLIQWLIVAVASISIIPLVEICKKILNSFIFERIK